MAGGRVLNRVQLVKFHSCGFGGTGNQSTPPSTESSIQRPGFEVTISSASFVRYLGSSIKAGRLWQRAPSIGMQIHTVLSLHKRILSVHLCFRGHVQIAYSIHFSKGPIFILHLRF